jgi:hypothetical protein
MRIYLFILVAFALIACYGCSERNSAGPTPEETVKMAQRGAAGSSQDNNTVSNPGMEEERRRRMQQGNQQEPDSGGEEEAAGDQTGDSSEAGEGGGADSSGQAGEDSAAESQNLAANRRSAARRRRQVQNPTMAGGGAMADMRKRREEEAAQQRQQQQQQAGSNLNPGNNPPPAQEEPEQTVEEKFESFYARAVKAFEARHDPEAFQFLYAHYLTSEDAFADHPLRWYDGISEPRAALRWGVGVSYSPGDFEGDPPVIGDPVESDTSDNAAGRGRSGGGDFGAPSGSRGSMGVSGGRNRRRGAGFGGGSDTPAGRGGALGSRDADRSPMETLTYYTGDFGEKLVRRYEMRRQHDDAYYGLVMQDIDEQTTEEESAETPGEQQPPEETTRRRSGGGDFGTLGGGANSDMLRERQRRQQARNRPGSSGNNDSDGPAYDAEETSLAPGLMFLGVGPEKRMLENARKLNLDVLVLFEVRIRHSERRNGDTSTKNNTRMRVYTVETGEELETDSRSLSNLAVASARERGREDPVELELDKVFGEMADLRFKGRELPEMDADIVSRRYEFLLGRKYDNPLPVLVEIRQYLENGLVSQNDYLSACEKLLGNEQARGLIDGDMKEKEKALLDFLPGKYQVSVQTGEDDEEEFR